MRREGRQHGFVQTTGLSQPPTNPRVLNQLDDRPTAGIFTKVPSKPTNHSKFTSKCRRPASAGCQERRRPASKSKHKAKGTNKNRKWTTTTTTTTTTQSSSDLLEFDEGRETSNEASEGESDRNDAVVSRPCLPSTDGPSAMERLRWEGGGGGDGEGVGHHHVLDDEWDVAYHPDDVLASDSVVIAVDALPLMAAGVVENEFDDQEEWLVITTNTRIN